MPNISGRYRLRSQQRAREHADAVGAAIAHAAIQAMKDEGAVQAGPVVAPKLEGEALAKKALLGENAYWLKLGKYVLAGATAYAVFLFCMWAVSVNVKGGAAAFLFRNDLSSNSGLMGMAILATIIVALQIAVRNPSPFDGEDRGMGRARALEFIAAICGSAAMAIGIAVAIRSASDGNLDPLHVLGPVVGGFLLAALAADASCGTDTILGSDLPNARTKLDIELLTDRLKNFSGEAKRPSGWTWTWQIALPIVILAGTTWIAYVRLEHDPWLLLTLSGITFASAVLIAVVDLYIRVRDVFWLLLGFRILAVVLATSALIGLGSTLTRSMREAGKTLGPEDAIFIILWAIGLAMLTGFAAFASTWACGSDTKQPGIARFCVQRAYRRRLAELNSVVASGTSAPQSPNRAATAAVVFAIILAPIGAVVAITLLTGQRENRKLKRLWVALGISVAIVVTLLVLTLIAINGIKVDGRS